MLGGALRPWSQTVVSEGARPWGRGRFEFAKYCKLCRHSGRHHLKDKGHTTADDSCRAAKETTCRPTKRNWKLWWQSSTEAQKCLGFFLVLCLHVSISSGRKLRSGRKLLPTDSLFCQINSVKTYRYRYRSVIISNQFLLLIPIPIPLQGTVTNKLPRCNSSELIMENLPIPIPICNFFELIR